MLHSLVSLHMYILAIIIVFLRLEHRGTVPVESCPLLFTSTQQRIKEGLPLVSDADYSSMLLWCRYYYYLFSGIFFLFITLVFSILLIAHWEVASFDLHANKIWVLDGRRQGRKSKCHSKSETFNILFCLLPSSGKLYANIVSSVENHLVRAHNVYLGVIFDFNTCLKSCRRRVHHNII